MRGSLLSIHLYLPFLSRVHIEDLISMFCPSISISHAVGQRSFQHWPCLFYHINISQPSDVASLVLLLPITPFICHQSHCWVKASSLLIPSFWAILSFTFEWLPLHGCSSLWWYNHLSPSTWQKPLQCCFCPSTTSCHSPSHRRIPLHCCVSETRESM